MKILKIPTEDIELKDSSDSKLQIEPISSIRILSILEVITKTSFSKVTKYSTLVQGRSDSEDDYEDYEENDEKEQAQITSKDAFGKNEFIGTDMTEKKRRKLKRVNCLVLLDNSYRLIFVNL